MRFYHNFEDTKTIKLLNNLNKIQKLYNILKKLSLIFHNLKSTGTPYRCVPLQKGTGHIDTITIQKVSIKRNTGRPFRSEEIIYSFFTLPSFLTFSRDVDPGGIACLSGNVVFLTPNSPVVEW